MTLFVQLHIKQAFICVPGICKIFGWLYDKLLYAVRYIHTTIAIMNLWATFVKCKYVCRTINELLLSVGLQFWIYLDIFYCIGSTSYQCSVFSRRCSVKRAWSGDICHCSCFADVVQPYTWKSERFRRRKFKYMSKNWEMN